MSHINTLSTFQTYKPFGDGFRLFQTKVVSNEDKRLLGRIKVKIPDLIPWDDKEKLPWIHPLYPAGLGEGPLASNFAVPEEDSQVVVIWPTKSIYFGYYAWHTNDRLNRMQDFHSEYPHRYGHQDSIENKVITNTHEKVNTIEQRWSDGTLSIHDSKESTNLYIDFHGTHIYIDRKEQKATVEFAGQKVDVTPDGIILQANRVIISGKDGVSINSTEGITLNAPYVVSGGRLIGKVSDNTESQQ
jgi:hypothetical protein